MSAIDPFRTFMPTYRLGRLAAIWVPLMVIMRIGVTVTTVQRGAAPSFFELLYFLVLSPLAILTFAGFTAAAVVLRRQSQWHRRLMFCGMALLRGPASADCCRCCWLYLTPAMPYSWQ